MSLTTINILQTVQTVGQVEELTYAGRFSEMSLSTTSTTASIFLSQIKNAN